MEAYAIYQRILMYGALAVLGTSAFLAVSVFVIRTMTPALVWIRRHGLQAMWLFPFVIGFAFYGATKSDIGTITYPQTEEGRDYLADAGSYVTNDAVHVAFTRDIIVPATANFFLYCLERRFTNQTDWTDHSIQAYSNTFDRMVVPFDFSYPAATNFNWMGFTDWTPSSSVHTNGVALIGWQIGKATNDIVIYRTGVYTNGVRIAPNPSITNSPAISLTLTQGVPDEN